jgi:hypothetical protein
VRHPIGREDEVLGLAEGLLLLAAWAVPVVVAVYVVRALGTLVLGMQSVNSAVQRIAASLDELVEAERRRANG